MPQIDRNQRARAMFRAEALDRRTHTAGLHGGTIKRTGLAVLKALLGYASSGGGFCSPAYETIGRAAGVARSTVGEALKRLEAAGLVRRIRRQCGPVRLSNLYTFVLPADPSADPSGPRPSEARKTASSEGRPVGTNNLKTPKNANAVPSPSTDAHTLAAFFGSDATTREQASERLRFAQEVFARRRRERA